VPARIVTEEELRALPLEWKTFGTLYTPGFRTNWGEWHMVREFYQNALDEHDEIGARALPRIELTPEGLIIKDYGRGFGVEGLLFKERKVTGDLRGTFGEGLKIACNTALRLGYDVEIESAMRSIEAVYVRRVVDTQELELYFIAKPQRPGVIGTTVLIRGYRGPTFTDRFTQFIPAPLHTRSLTIGRFAREDAILPEPPNRLYIRDIYVRDLSVSYPSRFSYNLWEVEPDPDRDAEKSTSELQAAIANLWATVTNTSLIHRFLEDARNPDRYEAQIDFTWFESLALVRESRAYWERAWLEHFGPRAVLFTGPSWAKVAEMYGYTTIEYPLGVRRFLEEAIPSDRSVSERRIEELKKPRPVPAHELTPTQRIHLEATQWLHSQLGYPRSPSIVAAEIPADPRTGEEADGLYDREENVIYIQPRVLDYMSTVIATYTHEMGHFVSGGALDGTREHVDGVQRVAALIAELLVQSPGHPIWRGVIWR